MDREINIQRKIQKKEVPIECVTSVDNCDRGTGPPGSPCDNLHGFQQCARQVQASSVRRKNNEKLRICTITWQCQKTI